MHTQPRVSQIIERVLTSGYITPTDQFQLLQAARLIEQPLSPEEHQQVRQVFEGIRLGIFQTVDG